MLLHIDHTTFIAYAVMGIILCLNLLFLWMYSAVVRQREKVSCNPEDGVNVSESNPPQTARVLRAHTNAEASIYPFLFLGVIFTLAGGNSTTAIITFGIFSTARWIHSFCYLGAKQPYRTIFFLISLFTQLALMIEIGILLIKG